MQVGGAKRMGTLLALATLGMGLGRGQALKSRGAVMSPELKEIYGSPEYEGFYTAAEKAYAESRPNRAFAATAWDSRRPLAWLMESERQLYAYSREFEGFKRQLDAATENLRIRHGVEKAAQISQLQDRLTADSLNTLNEMIRSLDLGALFTSNHRPNAAKLWMPRRVPESAHVLDSNKMEEVVAVLDDLNTCFAESGRLHVQYSRSASFSANVPTDENDKPLTRQQAEIFWQAYTHGPVDKALVALYVSLHKAQGLAESEGLLGTGAAARPAVVGAAAAGSAPML